MGGGGRWLGTIIAGGRILISCRFLPVWLAWPWPITSELCVTVSLPLLRREWTEAGAAEQAGESGGERSDMERKTKQDVWRWDCRSQEGEETKRGIVKSLARSNLHGREGTYVFYPANIEHDMWLTKEMKGFWTWILLMLEMFSGRAWNCTATDLTPLTNAIMHNSVIAAMISKCTIWPCLSPPTIELNHWYKQWTFANSYLNFYEGSFFEHVEVTWYRLPRKFAMLIKLDAAFAKGSVSQYFTPY